MAKTKKQDQGQGREKADKTSVGLNLYWKQGDDFSLCLKDEKDRPAAALEAWAKKLAAGAKALNAIAKKVAGKRGVTACGDTHLVSINGLTPELVDEIAKVAKGFVAIPDPAGTGSDEEE